MKKIRSLVLVALTVFTFGIVTGCSNNEVNKDNKEMRVVSSVKGDVEIPVNPERIVDISGSTEELLILGHKVVATANVDSYETDKLPSYLGNDLGDTKIVGHYMMDTMDIEAILSVNPDVIIMAERQEKIYDQLKEIAPVVMIKDSVNDWRTKLTDVAKVFDDEETANKWLSRYDEKAKKLGEEIKEANGQDKTYVTVLPSSGQFMVFTDAGLGTIINDDMGLARPTKLPVQDSITLPTVSIEGLAEIDADHIIVIATESDKQDLANSTVWPEIRAVKDGNVTILNATPFFGQSYNPVGKELLLESIKAEMVK
ncbi:MAG: iron-hydroxamate ABC transporter substrate-binding protein [Clostridium sp.]